MEKNVKYIIPRNKKYASKILFLNLGTLNYSDMKIKGMKRLIERHSNLKYQENFCQFDNYIIAKRYIKDKFKNFILLKNGWCIDIVNNFILNEKMYNKYKKYYNMGYDLYYYPLKGLTEIPCTRPRIKKTEMCSLINENLYLIDNKEFAKKLINAINEFKHPRIGKIFIDVKTEYGFERIYIHNMKYDLRISPIMVISQIDKITQEQDITIRISKNR